MVVQVGNLSHVLASMVLRPLAKVARVLASMIDGLDKVGRLLATGVAGDPVLTTKAFRTLLGLKVKMNKRSLQKIQPTKKKYLIWKTSVLALEGSLLLGRRRSIVLVLFLVLIAFILAISFLVTLVVR